MIYFKEKDSVKKRLTGDAIITQVKNIVHLKKNRMLLLQFNRFMWEDVEKGVFRKNKRILFSI